MHVITGGAGFIGSALLWQLNEMGVRDIIVVDHLGESEKWRNLVKRHYVDYMDRDEFIERARKGALPWVVESVVHLGACSSTTERNCDFLMENNFHYSRDICRIALDLGARFINASSASTYGAGEHGFNDDERIAPLLRPLNMYGYSKQLFDLWLLREGLAQSVASLKFFNVYGPNEYHKGNMRSVAVKLFYEIGATGRASLFASSAPGIQDGEQSRDFVYVKDCARLIAWLLLEAPQINGIRNVGSGMASTFNDLARSVFTAMNREPVINYIPMPESLARNYQNYTCAQMDWLTDVAYPHKFHSLHEGTGDYVRNYLATPDIYL